MRNFIFAAPIFFLLLHSHIVQGQASNSSAIATKRNLDEANSINRAIETGDVSHLGDYIAADAIDHSGQHGDVVGIDSIKKGLAPVHKLASGDLKMTVIKELADSEYVFQWIRTTGTAASTDMGVAKGSPFSLTLVSVTKFKDGKAVEHWEFEQPADIIKMVMAQGGK